jgi:hypothetical protein
MDKETENKLSMLVMTIVFIIAIIIALFTMSKEDIAYINSFKDTLPYLAIIIIIFIIVYGTPAYILIVLLSKIANFLKIGLVGKAMATLENIASIPLYLLSHGFCSIYFDWNKIQSEEERRSIRTLITNIAGIIVMFSFQLRLIYPVIICLFLSLWIYLVDWFGNVTTKK